MGRGQTWFNRSGSVISGWINRMMYSALDGGHPTFTHFPTDKRGYVVSSVRVGSKEEWTFGRFGSSRSVLLLLAPPPLLIRSTYGSLKDKDDRDIFVGDPDGGSTGRL
ncbi:hypothetical protein Bca52824_071423 [Brassica carinata]|uniref:Uncharacterized protein n=1 Tax=Brassica carinata TaxID=52824 RepID=A0A8X7U3Y5_BRACI|nr:hypothetical protein Bca52824_071423 [Brassica carinata]